MKMDSTQETLGISYFGPVEGSPLIPPQVTTLYFIVFFLLLIGAYFLTSKKKKPINIAHKLKLLLVSGVFIKVFLILGGSMLISYWLVPTPNVSQTTPLHNQQGSGTAKKIEIVFDRPISRKALEKTITPEVAGIWMFENSLYTTHFYQKLVFYPTVNLKPNTKYTVILSHVKNTLQTSPPYTYTFSFQTQDVPEVSSVNPLNGTDDFEVTSPINVTLTQSNEKISEFDFELTPPHPIEVHLNASKTSYTLVPKELLKQGTNYTLTIKKTDLILNLPTNTVILRGPQVQAYKGTFTTKEAPGIASFTPTETNVALNTPITIAFSKSMNRKSVEAHFSVEPKVLGTFQWIDDRIFTFIPKKLAYDTKYSVRVAQGAQDLGGGLIEGDILKSFSTIGRPKLISLYPKDGLSAVAVDNSINLTFDQEVDKSSAQSRFSIIPDIPGTFLWEDTKMVFKPSVEFAYSTRYQVILTPGLKSKYGLSSKEQFLATFTTADETVKLPVPAYLQQHALSCEVASLKMALALRGVTVSEEELLANVGIDTTPHKGNIWGNPYKLFVGNVDGKQMVDGYGVYWGPIGRVARAHRNAQEFENWSTPQLTEAIAQGNPVIIWAYSSRGIPTSWQTPEGQSIYAVRDEHTTLAVGFVGPKDNPSQIIINDPLVGQVYWPRALFERKWNIFQRSGVVIF